MIERLKKFQADSFFSNFFKLLVYSAITLKKRHYKIKTLLKTPHYKHRDAQK